MLPMILAGFLFLLLLGIISVYGYRAYVRPSRIYDRVGGAADPGIPIGATPAAKPREVVIRVIEQIGEQIPLSPADQTVSKRDLVMAGFRAEGAIQILVG